MTSPRRIARFSEAATTSADTSASSPGHFPTTTAARSRKAGNGSAADPAPRRFEDFVGSSSNAALPSSSEADDTFAATLNKGKAKSTQQSAPAKGRMSRMSLKSLAEEAETSDFAFTVEPKKKAAEPVATSSSSAMGPPMSKPSKRKTITEPLPSDTLGETPINRKNRLMRGGPAYPSTPLGGISRQRNTSSGSSSRRTSLTLKESRRSSSLRDGSLAHPHPQVADRELYRHCADSLPPVARMKHMAGWTLERARQETMASLPAPSTGPHRKPGQKPEAETETGDSQWTAQERKILERCRPSLERVMLATLRDLAEQRVNVSWLNDKQPPPADEVKPKKNPRNEANRHLSDNLSRLVESLRGENSRWEGEIKELEAFEAQTAAMLNGNSSIAQGGDPTAPPATGEWKLDSLDPNAAQMLKDAQRALAMEERWLPSSEAGANEVDVLQGAIQAAALSRRESSAATVNGKKGKRKSEASDSDEASSSVGGSELDPRWDDFEFKSDVLRSQTHLLDRLLLLSSSYTSATSSRAAQALHQLAFAPPEASASTSAVGGSSSASASGEANRSVQRSQKETILRGIRESIGSGRRLEMEAEARLLQEQQGEDDLDEDARDDSGIQIGGADQSAIDLFRAFSNIGRTKKARPSSRVSLAPAGSSVLPTTTPGEGAVAGSSSSAAASARPSMGKAVKGRKSRRG